MEVRLFDFDRTFNQEHTFGHNNKLAHKNLTPEQSYQTGKEHALTNLKLGLANWFKHDDSGNTSAIVTFHNNPNYIAGYVAVLLGKELIAEPSDEDNSNEIGLARFKVVGLEQPFFISYINRTGAEFDQTIKALLNKNKLIEKMRTLFQKSGILKDGDIIKFYDDDQKNYLAALSLGEIESTLVYGALPSFTPRQTRLNPEKAIVPTVTVTEYIEPVATAASANMMECKVGMHAFFLAAAPAESSSSYIAQSSNDDRTFLKSSR